jgi:hypothetical protein
MAEEPASHFPAHEQVDRRGLPKRARVRPRASGSLAGRQLEIVVPSAESNGLAKFSGAQGSARDLLKFIEPGRPAMSVANAYAMIEPNSKRHRRP